MADVFPPRNLGKSENWGRVLERRYTAAEKALSGGELNRLGNARATTATLASLATQTDKLESALNSLPIMLTGGQTVSGFELPSDWQTRGQVDLTFPSGKTRLDVVAVGNGYIHDERESGTTTSFVWPFDLSHVTSEYGPRTGGVGTFHEGIDFGGVTGNAIVAAGDGTVEVSGYHSNFGNYVILNHGIIGLLQVKTLYAHMASSPSVSVGASVTMGSTVLGYVGSTGAALGAHLHWETHVMAPGTGIVWNTADNGGYRTAINPRTFMDLYGGGVVSGAAHSWITSRIVIGGSVSHDYIASRHDTLTVAASQFYQLHGATISGSSGDRISVLLQYNPTTNSPVPPSVYSRSTLSVFGAFS